MSSSPRSPRRNARPGGVDHLSGQARDRAFLTLVQIRERMVDALSIALWEAVRASMLQTERPEATLREMEAQDDEVAAVAHALRVALNCLAVGEGPRGRTFYAAVIRAIDGLYSPQRGLYAEAGPGVTQPSHHLKRTVLFDPQDRGEWSER